MTAWTIERRARQSERIRSCKPWLKSTGPRSAAGKKVVSLNAWRHGGRSRAMRIANRAIKVALAMQDHFIDTVRHCLELEDRFPARPAHEWFTKLWPVAHAGGGKNPCIATTRSLTHPSLRVRVGAV